jgi:hypothetical protein
MEPDYNYNVWEETYDPDFIDMCKRSRLPEKWINSHNIDPKYKDSIIKPINQYLEYMSSPPKLISIVGNTVTLQYQNFADIYIKRRRNGKYYHSERPWLRQYYRSLDNWESDRGLTTDAHKMITTWIVDADVVARVYEPENSPLEVPESTLSFYKTNSSSVYFNPQFVSFKFKLYGNHMKDGGRYGELLKKSPLFNIEFQASDIIIERVRKFYEEEQDK